MPKWTGRKRKRGSGGSFVEAEAEAASGRGVVDDGTAQGLRRRSARDVVRALRDNVGRYRVEGVGRVERTHVFRGEFGFVFGFSFGFLRPWPRWAGWVG